MTLEQNELDGFKRRGFLKLLVGASAASMVGVPTISTAKSFIDGEVVTSLSLSKLFNIQAMNAEFPSGLLFNLKSELYTPDQLREYKFSVNSQPEVVVSLVRETVECKWLQLGDVTNSIKLFIDKVLRELPFSNETPNQASSSIAGSSMRGVGNCVLSHTSKSKDLFEQQFQTGPMTFVYSDHMPKDKCIVWYNGCSFYDGVVTIAHDMNNIDKYLVVVYTENLSNYCRLINI